MKRNAWAAAARAALIVVGLAPLWTAWARDLPVLGTLASPFEAWFAFQCERDPARTLAWFPALAVCSRCLGIYLGLGFGAVLLRPRLSPAGLRLWIAVAAVIMLLDVTSELLGLRPAVSLLRSATGFALAYPVGAALIAALSSSSSE
jgi:uncharacterized membrane protein